jgi:Gpi18-like mannosyltransferase
MAAKCRRVIQKTAFPGHAGRIAIFPPLASPAHCAKSVNAKFIILAVCILLSVVLRIYFLCTPGFRDDLRWHLHWGERVVKEGLFGLYRGDFANRSKKNLFDVVDYPPVVPLLTGGIVAIPKKYRIFRRDTLLKIAVTLFEIAVIALLVRIVLTSTVEPERIRLFMAALLILSPALALTTSCFGQEDSLFSLLFVLALALISRGALWPAFVLMLLAVLTKPQGVLAMGCYFLILLAQRRYFTIFTQAACGFVVLLVLILAFRLGAESDFLAIYTKAIGAYPSTSWTAFNLWWAFLGDKAPGIRDSVGWGLLSYRTIGLLLYSTAMLAGITFLFKSKPSLENTMLFCGWLFLAFFLLSTQMHERYLYYSVVLLALPAMKSQLLLAAYLVLNVVLYLNVGYCLDRFSPGTFVPLIAPHLPVALQRALAFAALVGGATFLFAIVSPLLGRKLKGSAASTMTTSESVSIRT